MPADKPTELSRIKLITWSWQPIPMSSEHSSHSTPMSAGFRTWLWRYTYLLLLISMIWHRQAIFKSKGDKLSSSAECRIRTQGFRHQIASILNARWQIYWAIENQAINVNSTGHPIWELTIILAAFIWSYLVFECPITLWREMKFGMCIYANIGFCVAYH